MYGHHSIPLRIEEVGISISLEKLDDSFVYRRDGAGGQVKKILLEKPERVTISPVEPVNLPKQVAQYVLVEFATPVLVRPGGDKGVFLKFPAEIGVFLSRKGGNSLIDTFSLSSPKYALYGSPRGGVICRTWVSEVFASKPTVKPLLEGILALRITSGSDEWVTVRKAVFDVHGMKIRHTDSLVATRAEMHVIAGGHAETEFIETPFQQQMQKSVELFRMSKLTVSSSRYHMGDGL